MDLRPAIANVCHVKTSTQRVPGCTLCIGVITDAIEPIERELAKERRGGDHKGKFPILNGRVLYKAAKDDDRQISGLQDRSRMAEGEGELWQRGAILYMLGKGGFD